MQRKIKEERDILKLYLSQYLICKGRKRQLEKRLLNIKNEMDSPIGGNGYKPTPHSNTNKVGAGAAEIIYRLAEIEERILEEKNEIAKSMTSVMNIIDFLPTGSTERMIIEYKYIDGMKWSEIERETYLSRSVCFDYFAHALDILLNYKKVQVIIEDFTKKKTA